ncbi:hypothetical protein [Holdemanella biformis]|nr:hypothetical protein [Holdemanella biformis]
MANENLFRLIEQTPDIKKRFKTEYISFGKPAGKPDNHFHSKSC